VADAGRPVGIPAVTTVTVAGPERRITERRRESIASRASVESVAGSRNNRRLENENNLYCPVFPTVLPRRFPPGTKSLLKRTVLGLALYGKECIVCERDQNRVPELCKVILEALQMIVEAASSCDHHGD
jgi:hypothetical protein